jgi:hypothetical protein
MGLGSRCAGAGWPVVGLVGHTLCQPDSCAPLTPRIGPPPRRSSAWSLWPTLGHDRIECADRPCCGATG